jgi:hypothetical protein
VAFISDVIVGLLKANAGIVSHKHQAASRASRRVSSPVETTFSKGPWLLRRSSCRIWANQTLEAAEPILSPPHEALFG